MDKPEEIGEDDLRFYRSYANGFDDQEFVRMDRLMFLAFITEIERLRAERDRLAALVECAAGFDLEEGDTRISFQSNGWTVETEDDDKVRMLSTEIQWEYYGSREWASSYFLFPTREAAFSAFEAARAKETAE